MPKQLSMEVFRNPGFDVMGPVRRSRQPTRSEDEIFDPPMSLAEDEGDIIYEGVTYTDQYNKVGYTYVLKTGMLSIVNTNNQLLFSGVLEGDEDFVRAMKAADKKQGQLDAKSRRKKKK